MKNLTILFLSIFFTLNLYAETTPIFANSKYNNINPFAFNDKQSSFDVGYNYNRINNTPTMQFGVNFYNIYVGTSFNFTSLKIKESEYGHGGILDEVGYASMKVGYNLTCNLNTESKYYFFATPYIGFGVNNTYYSDKYYGKPEVYYSKTDFLFGINIGMYLNKIKLYFNVDNNEMGINIGIVPTQFFK